MQVGAGDGLDAIAGALVQARQEAATAVHAGGQVNSINVNGMGRELCSQAEGMLVRRTEKGVPGQTLTRGPDGGSGNRGLGRPRDGVREDKTTAGAKLVRSNVQRAAEACFRLNGLSGGSAGSGLRRRPPARGGAGGRAARDAVLKQSGTVQGFSEGLPHGQLWGTARGDTDA
ncbi:MAG: DUF935 domain-containing protein [Deltaproteobacteria bacterium]|jgi:hypothetical protein|nr:DUF935 domain-containing protein [Deltaproteobacteria bacterium]